MHSLALRDYEIEATNGKIIAEAGEIFLGISPAVKKRTTQFFSLRLFAGRLLEEESRYP
jgi:hypothetical protein